MSNDAAASSSSSSTLIIADAVRDLCGDDVLLSSRATRTLEAAFSADVVLADGEEVRQFAATALDRQAHPTARRFAASRLVAAATASPQDFLRSSHATLCAKSIASQEEDVGIADIAARALMVAAADDDRSLKPLLEAGSAGSSDAEVTALLRLAGAGLALPGDRSQQPRHPLGGGFIATALGRHFDAAVTSDDALMLVTIATLTLSAGRWCDLHAILGDSVVKYATGLISDPAKAGDLVLPYVLQGVGFCLARDPSPQQVNTKAFGPALAAYFARPAPRDLSHWAVALGALLSTSTGCEFLVEPSMRAQLGHDVEAGVRHGNSENRIAALHAVEAAAACRPVSACPLPWLLTEGCGAGMVAATASADDESRAAAWTALGAVLRAYNEAEAIGSTAFVAAIAPVVPRPLVEPLTRRLVIALDRENPAIAAEAAVHRAACGAGAALLAAGTVLADFVAASHREAWDAAVTALQKHGVHPPAADACMDL